MQSTLKADNDKNRPIAVENGFSLIISSRLSLSSIDTKSTHLTVCPKSPSKSIKTCQSIGPSTNDVAYAFDCSVSLQQ